MPQKGAIMSPHRISLPPHHEAVEHFDYSARMLRERFRSSVSAALPGFARRAFAREWQESSDLAHIESIPPLVVAYLMSCERCIQDLLNRNYEGLATGHFEKCVSEAAIDIMAKVMASCSYDGVITFPEKRTS
jgi:hypothetical protein